MHGEIINITLQSLANNKTLLIIHNIGSDFSNSYYYADIFVNRLLSELKKLGFIEAWYKKALRIIKEVIGIAQVAKS